MARQRIGGLPPEIARYEEESQVLAGERGDRRDHAIRTSHAFSIEGRQEILGALGIETDDLGRPVSKKLFSAGLIDEADYNVNRYDNVVSNGLGLAPGMVESFVAVPNLNRAPFWGTSQAWKPPLARKTFSVGRSNGLISEFSRQVGTPLVRVFSGTANWPQILFVSTFRVLASAGATIDDDDFDIASYFGVETIPGDVMELNVVANIYQEPPLPANPTTADTIEFGILRYAHAGLRQEAAIPDMIKGPSFLPQLNRGKNEFRLRENVETDYEANTPGLNALLARLGVDLERAYPAVHPYVRGYANLRSREHTFGIHQIYVRRV